MYGTTRALPSGRVQVRDSLPNGRQHPPAPSPTASTVADPVIAYQVAADRLRAPLDQLRGWPEKENAVITPTCCS